MTNNDQFIENTKRNEYGLTKVHNEYLIILDDFHQYCMAHGIQYSLSGGSLLGAVRHHGFIPWDDDADVMFDRKNYEKFLDSFKSHPMKEYEIIGNSWVKRITRSDNPDIDKEEQCIDLFVFDVVPDSEIKAKLKS